MTTRKPISQNNRLILLMIVTSILLVVVLGILYLTYGQNSSQSTIQNDSTSSILASSPKVQNIKTFDEEAPSQPEANNSNPSQKPQQIISSTTITLNSNSEDIDISKFTAIPKIDTKLTREDREVLGNYIDYDQRELESLITAKILGQTGDDILVLKIPSQKILKKVNLDFPNTFRLANEDRLPVANDRIVLYYPSQKRAAYLGEFITDVYDFKYEGQNYWLSVYLSDLIISKADFGDWKFVALGEDIIESINKKNDFEFEITTKYLFEDLVEYNKQIISPQKYIIDGIFSPVSD
jgi:hypothetical protein